jgi:hypothetical protein
MTKTVMMTDLEIPNQLMFSILNTFLFAILGSGHFKGLLFNFMFFKD